jgi:hypothetical protein
MNRREFLKLSASAAAAASLPISSWTWSAPATQPDTQFDHYFVTILDGFLRNAKATSDSFAVCDYPDGTKLKSCCNPAGKTYVSVARMMPAMVEWMHAKKEPASDIENTLLNIFRHAFDPKHPDFWGYAPDNRATQLSVESALVAHALAMSGKEFVEKLTPAERANVNKWLASCTQVAERKNNHAWFTACNQAARLELSRSFPEFHGDEAWMLADLKAMDELATTATTPDGWYTDSPDQPIYDVYNFYVFPNFPLMWGQIIGARYPQWNEKFRARIKIFLQRTPYFFAANGSHPLMGRSLIYRWACLSPLILGYREGLWPHSPGLLRAIVRRQLEYHWSLGCYDAEKGKLRESFTRDGTGVTREPYVDNGHPYWTMLGFAFFGIKADDPFWTAAEEPLPVEKGDFVEKFDGPKFLLSGTKRTGEVRWVMSQNAAKREPYRDKYSKFSWSSHFGFNSINDKERVPADQALVFRNIETGACATRAPAGVTAGKLLDDGVGTSWFAQLGDWKIEVVSRVRIVGEFEERTHRITAPAEAVGKVEIVEGSRAKPVDGPELVHLWPIRGYDRVETATLDMANLLYAKVSFQQAIGKLTGPQVTVALISYASPKPPATDEVMRRGEELKSAWREKV